MKTQLLILALLMPGSVIAEGVLTPAANPSSTVTTLTSSGIVFIYPSSGTMGNNGALSGITALPATYSNGAYIFLPAASIAAGVPASATWYWVVMSSTTAGTVYDSTYTSGEPRAGTLTAFSTTGPGAFTAGTGAATSITVSLPANTLGLNNVIQVTGARANINSGGSKLVTVTIGATAICASSSASATSGVFIAYLQGYNSTASQVGGCSYVATTAAAGSATSGANDGTTALTLDIALSKPAATDWLVLYGYNATVTRK